MEDHDFSIIYSFFNEFKFNLGANIPDNIDEIFTKVRDNMNSDSFKEINGRLLLKEGRRTDWYRKLANTIGDCQRMAGQCFYHFDNLRDYENVAINIINKYKPALEANQGMGITCEKLDYEFHALMFSIKVYISYVAKAVFTYFKSDVHSFADYEKQLSRLLPKEKSTKLIEFLNGQWDRLSLYYSTDDRRTVRDAITHYNFVGAGTINIYNINDKTVAAMALPEVVVDNEYLKPEYKPEKVNDIGLGVTELMYSHLIYIFSLTNKIYSILELV